MEVDPKVALERAANCHRLAKGIDQAVINWLSGRDSLYDVTEFRPVWPLLNQHLDPLLIVDGAPDGAHLWSAIYRALRAEFYAIEPLLNQYGDWLGNVPFERWLGGDGVPTSFYTAAVNAIAVEETADQYDEDSHHGRVTAAAREMLHGGESSDFRRFAVRAGGEIGTDCREFCLALDGVVREMKRRLDDTLTPDEERSKFCFDQWQTGSTLKQINAALKKHATWDHFSDYKAVRGPINSWAKRIGVSPRIAQRGRRKSTK